MRIITPFLTPKTTNCLFLGMLLLSLINLLYATSLTLLFAPSPIALGTLILLLALQLRAILSLSSSSWFAILLFLIYIGGLLVIFSYFIALCPNLPIPMGRPVFAFLFTFTLCQSLLILSPPILNLWPLTPSKIPSLSSILAPHNLPLLLFLARILFFALILVVKLRSRTSGPLRPFSAPSYDQLP